MSLRLTLLSLFLSVLTILRVLDAITIENKDGINQYWYAMYISGENGDAEITDVYIRDSSSGSSWSQGTLTYYDFWAFQSDETNGWTLPLSVRIENSNGEQINSYNLITNFNWNEQFSFGSNFVSNSPAPPENSDIEIINKNGINQWWHAFYVMNINTNGGEITNVEIRDSSNGASWESGYSDTNGELGTFYAFQNNDGWELPFDIRLTNCGGETLTSYSVITNRIEYGIYDFDDNFADTTCPSPTPEPTPIPSSSSSSSNIKVTKFQGYNIYWVALSIDDVTSGTTIQSVELRDGGNDGIWNTGVYHDWGAVKVYTFDIDAQNRPFELSFDIRITDTNGVVLQADELVTAWTDGAEYDFGSNF